MKLLKVSPRERNSNAPRLCLLQLLLRSELVGASALLLSAVGRARRKTGVALAAHFLLAVVLASEGGESRVDGSSSETKDQVKRGLLGDVVVAERSTILELLSGEDKSLLIGGDSLLVLDLLLHAFDGVAGLDVQGDRLTRQGLYENLHVGI